MNKKEKKHINTYRYSIPQETGQTVNKTFVRGTIYILDCVQIANRTKFVKEYVDKARYGLDYLPVIGYYIDGDFQNHAIDYYFDEEGNLKEEVLTIPYGTVIAGTSRWEKICMEDGEIRDVLAVDCYFWKERNPEAINRLMANKNSQSMEITIDSYENRDGYIEVRDFNFQSLCILGNNTRPAFKCGKVKVDSKYSKNEQFKLEYEEMLKALDNYITEGGIEPMATAKKSTQEDENALQQDANVAPISEPVEEPKEAPVEDNKDEEPSNPVEPIAEPTGEGQEDTQDEEAEDDSAEESTEEEFACGTKKKKKTMENEENFEEKYNSLNTEYATVKTEKAELEKQYNALMEEVLQLREYKLNKEKELRAEKESEIFSKFEEIAKDESFIDLKKNSANYSLEELEDRAYAIYGRINKTKEDKNTNKNKKQSTVTIYNNVDSSDFEENKITNSISELINKYKNK